jgi:hypothetical protein
MTKKELIEALKEIPDNAEVKMNVNGFLGNLRSVEMSDIINAVYLYNIS